MVEDDYDYPEDLPQVVLNRPKAILARAKSDPMSRLGASVFGQLFLELHFLNPRILRIAYTHPMDDGQQRSFKVKFQGEGVDDYGGPYRECYTQISDELQAMNNNGGEKECVLPLFRVSPNYTRDGKGVRFVLNPMSCHTPDRMVVRGSLRDVKAKNRFCSFRPFDSFYWDQLALHTEMFAFLGQLMGMAIRNQLCLPLDLDPIVWKILVKEKLCREDLKTIDESTYDLLKQIERGDYDDADNNKVEEMQNWTFPLSNGVRMKLGPYQFSEINEKNRKRFVELAFQERLREGEVAAKVCLFTFDSLLMLVTHSFTLSTRVYIYTHVRILQHIQHRQYAWDS